MRQRRVPVPRTLAELMSPGWLSSALSARFPGVQITSVTPGPVVSRVSTNARFHIECEGGAPSGLPPDLCGKGYFTGDGWPARHIGAFEVSFYRDLAARTGIRTLRSVYADADPETGHGVIITEEVRHAERLVGAYRALAEQARDTSPWSVIHGDAHVGNLYRSRRPRCRCGG